MTADELKDLEIALSRFRGYIDGALTWLLWDNPGALEVLSLDRALVDNCRTALEREAARIRARERA